MFYCRHFCGYLLLSNVQCYFLWQVEPGPFDIVLTELFQWNEGSFLSTLHGRTHSFQVHLPNDEPGVYTEGQKMDELFGIAGQPGTFYIQLRDEFGNLVQTRLNETSLLSVQIIGQRNGELIYLGTEASPDIPEMNYMGSGIYAVRFFSSEAATYTVRIEVDGLEVKQVVQDAITLRWKPGGGFYQLRIRPSVTAPAMCEAYGPGLRGALVDVVTSINIVAKDNLGNPRDETGAEQASTLWNHRCLFCIHVAHLKQICSSAIGVVPSPSPACSVNLGLLTLVTAACNTICSWTRRRGSTCS